MKKICRYLVDTLDLDNQIYDILYYGLFVITTNIISIISVVFIGYLLGQLKNTIIFLMFFAPIRLYIGGYHALTPIKCYWYFNIISTMFILLFKLSLNVDVLSFITFISLCFVLIQVNITKQGYKVNVVVLLYLLSIIILKSYDIYTVFLLAILMSVVLYEMKFLTKKS